MTHPLPRLADGEVQAAIGAHPAVLITGPRACGKTTTATAEAASVVRLDVESDAALFRIDPDAALAAAGERPVLLDEWQDVPGVMGAIKRATDAGAPPGSFVLTGSTRADTGDGTWPGTGRVVEIRLAPLTQREASGAARGVGMVERLVSGEEPAATHPDPPDVTAYVDLAMRGGFPEPALHLAAPARKRWYDNYIHQVTDRDLLTLLRRADPGRARRYLEAYALNSAGVVDDTTLIQAAGINRKTAMGYEAALTRLFVIESLPAWGSNRLSRMVRMPKRFVADPALMAAAARVTRDDILHDGMLLGRLLETLVRAQVQPELDALGRGSALFHLRDANGRREVDLIIDLGGGRVIGIEVKATAAPTPGDARHLAWLRDTLGHHFIRGIVFHTGPHVFALGDRILARPIADLWAAATR